MNQLPRAFMTRMESMLGEEFPLFLEEYGKDRLYGLRVNTAKISLEEFERICPFEIRPIPWIENGYFYDWEAHPAASPLYHAGLYYLQEPSAMTPASRLNINPGDRVLDMCAAPGGKATALGDALNNTGFLMANDLSLPRTRALLRNLELTGVTNALVVNNHPKDFADTYEGYFDKILLDAPCSGEGMFRKSESLLKDWTPEKSEELSKIQKELAHLAVKMLAPGGRLLYSTCTFAPAEDEEVIEEILREHPDMELIPMKPYQGFAPGYSLKDCVRIFPHKMPGEGHFLALLQKKGTASKSATKPSCRQDGEGRKLIQEFFDQTEINTLAGSPIDWKRVDIKKEKVYFLPPIVPPASRLNFLRNGLYMGELKKKRFEPSQPLALALRKGEAKKIIDLPVDDPRIIEYLKGNPIADIGHSNEKGWHLLTVEGYPLAFGKLVNQSLKNKIPPGWRLA